MTEETRPLIFVTGLSGAGISTALKALEDCGYEVFDNFPLAHVETLLNETGFETHPIAIGFDSRTRGYDPDGLMHLARRLGAKILFLTATNTSLETRFSETRRKHPLAKDRTVTDGILHERKWLEPLTHSADQTIDTTDLTVHDFKHLIEQDYRLDRGHKKLSVTIRSFGFKYGVPRQVDMILDVRFLRNPHWDTELRFLTGQNEEVQAYIEQDANLEAFYKKMLDMIDFLLPRYSAEGKSYFTIGLGCTGGKHRSVYLAERLAKDIQSLDYDVTVRHRDMKD